MALHAADAARTIKRVTMEFGGKSANIICADADVAAASARSHTSYTLNAGQYCEAGSRLLVDRRLEDTVVEHLTPNSSMTSATPSHRRRATTASSMSAPQSGSPAWWSAARPPGRASRPAGSAARTPPARFFPPTVITGAASRQRDRPGRDLRAGGLRAAVRRHQRGHRARERDPLRARRGHPDSSISRVFGSPNGSRSARSGSMTGRPAASRCRLADASSPASGASAAGLDEYLEYKSILSPPGAEERRAPVTRRALRPDLLDHLVDALERDVVDELGHRVLAP